MPPQGAPGGAQGAQGAPLGIGTRNVSGAAGGIPAQSPPEAGGGRTERRAQREPVSRSRQLVRKFRLLDTVAKILPGHRTSWCGRRPLAQGVAVVYHPEHKSAAYAGVAVCGSVWCCPVCAARIAVQRAQELKRGAEIWTKRGGHLLMLTLTIRHQWRHKLKFLLKALNAAYREIRQGRAFMRFKAEYGLVGSVTGREITQGKRGWHPHLHALLFVERYCDMREQQKIKRWIHERWIKALKKYNLNVTYERGVNISDIDVKDTDYLMKVAEAWAGAGEVTGALAKEARRGNRTPQKLLRLAADGDAEATRLYQEYAAATKGLKLLVWSKGLRKRLFGTEEEKTDQELAEETQVGGIELFELNLTQWKTILKHNLRGELLAECCAGDIDTPVQFLAGWGITLAPHQLKYTFRCKNTPKGEGE